MNILSKPSKRQLLNATVSLLTIVFLLAASYYLSSGELGDYAYIGVIAKLVNISLAVSVFRLTLIWMDISMGFSLTKWANDADCYDLSVFLTGRMIALAIIIGLVMGG